MSLRATTLPASALAVSVLSTSANAALLSRLGGQAVYDTDLNITWLADANLAASNTFGLPRNTDLGTFPVYWVSIIYNGGGMTWGGALKWIGAMNTANYLGYSDWRLPATTDTNTTGCNFSYNSTDCGYNSTGSEMTHLFYGELSNKAYYDTSGAGPQPGWGLTSTGQFSNLQPATYWSGTERAGYTFSSTAWAFDFNTGYQGTGDKSSALYALAVRSGDVAAVPLPAATYLLGSGLLALLGVARRYR